VALAAQARAQRVKPRPPGWNPLRGGEPEIILKCNPAAGGTAKQRGIISNGVKEERMTKGLGNILKQAQQIHAKISQLQEEMAGKTVEASSGGGMVNIVMNGKQEVVSIRIDPEVVNREDIEMLQDLMVAAVNEAIRKSQEMMTEEMKKITGGLNIPGLF
jgi:DNA-binding YbaB/EbfC family protein